MHTLTLAQIEHWGANIVLISSVLHTALPPYEVFSDYPGAMKFYKLILTLLSFLAVSRRSAVYQSISTAGGTVPSPAAITTGTTTPEKIQNAITDAKVSAAESKS